MRSVVRTWPVILTVALVLAIAAILTRSAPADAGTAESAPASEPGDYLILGWNDLGMHCYDSDFADIAVLPPYNTLWVQVLQRSDPPRIVTQGITVEYSFPGNTTSANKTNFWQYATKLFGVNLPLDVGLRGKGLSGQMDFNLDHFEAVGIPLTEYRDQDVASGTRYPFQLAQIIVRDGATGAELARQNVVAPVSTEMSCQDCHADDGDATTAYPITPTGKVETNILAIHDYLSQDRYPAGHTGPLLDPARRPVLCADCHSSNALGLPGIAGIASLSNAMHRHHQDLDDIVGAPTTTDGCYKCHPGPTTQCLRDVMSEEYNFTCTDCHGPMSQVAQNAQPWLSEPRCDSQACHGDIAKQTEPLFRMSIGHGRLYCEACHDSTHAIAKSREPNDAIKFINLQGHDGTLKECSVCHLSEPASRFSHAAPPLQYFLPAVIQ